MLRIVLVGLMMFGLSACTVRSPGPGEYGLQAWFSDPPETEEKCLQRVKREFWKRRRRSLTYNPFGIDPKWFDPFGLEEERRRILAEQEAADQKKCQDHFGARSAALRSEAIEKHGGIVSKSDPFGLSQDANVIRQRPNLKGDLTNLLPKPAAKKTSQEIYQERLSEYLDSPFRGGANAAIQGFDYRAAGCAAGNSPRLGC